MCNEEIRKPKIFYLSYFKFNEKKKKTLLKLHRKVCRGQYTNMHVKEMFIPDNN